MLLRWLACKRIDSSLQLEVIHLVQRVDMKKIFLKILALLTALLFACYPLKDIVLHA